MSQGPIDKVIELAFNPSRDKIREVTVVDRLQARYFPQLDMLDNIWDYIIATAEYRMKQWYAGRNEEPTIDEEMPNPPEPMKEFIYRVAQWQKSVAGKNLDRATDIALAEVE